MVFYGSETANTVQKNIELKNLEFFMTVDEVIEAMGYSDSDYMFEEDCNISAADCSSVKDGYYLWSCFDNVNIELIISIYEGSDTGRFNFIKSY